MTCYDHLAWSPHALGLSAWSVWVILDPDVTTKRAAEMLNYADASSVRKHRRTLDDHDLTVPGPKRGVWLRPPPEQWSPLLDAAIGRHPKAAMLRHRRALLVANDRYQLRRTRARHEAGGRPGLAMSELSDELSLEDDADLLAFDVAVECGDLDVRTPAPNSEVTSDPDDERVTTSYLHQDAPTVLGRPVPPRDPSLFDAAARATLRWGGKPDQQWEPPPHRCSTRGCTEPPQRGAFCRAHGCETPPIGSG